MGDIIAAAYKHKNTQPLATPVTLGTADLAITLAQPVLLPESNVTYPYALFSLSIATQVVQQPVLDASGHPVLDSAGDPTYQAVVQGTGAVQVQAGRLLTTGAVDMGPAPLNDSVAFAFGPNAPISDPNVLAIVHGLVADIKTAIGA